MRPIMSNKFIIIFSVLPATNDVIPRFAEFPETNFKPENEWERPFWGIYGFGST